MSELQASLLLFALAPVFLAGVGLEMLGYRRLRRRGGDQRGLGYLRKDTIASLTMGSGFTVIYLAVAGLLYLVMRPIYAHRLFDLGTGPGTWLLAALVWDFVYYWKHRAEHEIRIMWAEHVNHHSSERYNYSTALRQTWTPFLDHAFVLPLAWLGFPPAMVIGTVAINMLYQFWIHTELIGTLPRPVELLFNTPSHHRVHHGSNGRYLDRNYGGILIVFDRLFGTFEPEREPVVYGLTKNIYTYRPLRIAFHEYAAIGRDLRSTRAPGEWLGYLFRRPGWQPQRLREAVAPAVA